jgi:hypothetical protein
MITDDNPDMVNLKDGEVALVLAQPPGEERYITVNVYLDGKPHLQERAYTINALINILNQVNPL